LHMKVHTRKMLEEFMHAAEFKDADKASTSAADHFLEVNQIAMSLETKRGRSSTHQWQCFVFVQKEQARFATYSAILVHWSSVSR